MMLCPPKRSRASFSTFVSEIHRSSTARVFEGRLTIVGLSLAAAKMMSGSVLRFGSSLRVSVWVDVAFLW